MQRSRSYNVGGYQARRRTPIAAEFEDCAQVFQQLCSSLEAGSTAWGGSESKLVGLFGRLRAWGNESGASTRSLDHRLRKASKLQNQVLEFLGDFKIDLENGMPPSCSVDFRCDVESTSVFIFKFRSSAEYYWCFFPYNYDSVLKSAYNLNFKPTHCVKWF